MPCFVSSLTSIDMSRTYCTYALSIIAYISGFCMYYVHVDGILSFSELIGKSGFSIARLLLLKETSAKEEEEEEGRSREEEYGDVGQREEEEEGRSREEENGDGNPKGGGIGGEIQRKGVWRQRPERRRKRMRDLEKRIMGTTAREEKE
ncbi:hypothetical protein IFM89_016074 [Coptis chinensis]|uniref:Uncharacterized protein n=1 Tax=Coptis chinensis TaxID=261450 RepID=A0A835M533_9MAGN|nr:hypothetical protein IFM89_016074 [Coptis chinensis]